MHWGSAFGGERDKRPAHLDALPAAGLREDLEALQRTFYVFNTNAGELGVHVAKFVASNQMSNQLSDDYVNDLVRLLHNYLTSVTSLVDSQRVVMRHRWPHDPNTSEPPIAATPAICAGCNRPVATNAKLSEFEATGYAEKLANTFETGEGVFMSKLRNYCTHYSVLLPALGTTINWDQTTGMRQTNTLQLERDKLLRWDGWTAPAKSYLQQQPERFDLAPIIYRYVNSAKQFAAWFWDEMTNRSTEFIDESTAKATELHLWQEEHVGQPDWINESGITSPPGWNGRLWRAGQRRDRYEHGTRGFRLWEFVGGELVLYKDDDWTPLPRYPRVSQDVPRPHPGG
jgi:hypothetical protein